MRALEAAPLARLGRRRGMRRLLTAPACAAVLLTAVAGCGAPPAGVDGDLTNGWPAPPAAAAFRPEAGRCHDTVGLTSPQETYAPRDCGAWHVAETIHVGDLTGAAADGTESDREPGPDARAAAFAACTKRADAFLGGRWRTGAVELMTLLPGEAGRRGGSRWFRCDLAQIEHNTGEPAGRYGSLKGALAGSAPLRLRCFEPKIAGDSVQEMEPVVCASGHHAEFAGLWTAPDMPWSTLATSQDKINGGCLGVVATYVGVRNDGMLKYRTGVITLAPNKAQWAVGQRAVRCFVYIGHRTLKGSVKGTSTKALPVNRA
jgi:Septum formation